ncbi:hypothetical protein ABZX90_31370 [Streptomyces sp. NPDC002935]|uniref:hypothetical protein n=1 Tax=Streptomyces sp. NPDC002935 TaxID=3154545 RepID=UPI0033A39389
MIKWVLALEALGLLLLVATRLTNEVTGLLEALKRLIREWRGPGSGPPDGV